MLAKWRNRQILEDNISLGPPIPSNNAENTALKLMKLVERKNEIKRVINDSSMIIFKLELD